MLYILNYAINSLIARGIMYFLSFSMNRFHTQFSFFAVTDLELRFQNKFPLLDILNNAALRPLTALRKVRKEDHRSYCPY